MIAFLTALVPALAGWWASGFPLNPLWALVLIAPATWVIGLALGWRRLVALGFAANLALAAALAVTAGAVPALTVISLALFAWDLSDAWMALRRVPRKERRLLLGRVALRSALVAGASWGLGWSFTTFRFRLPFWGLVGIMALSWGLFYLLLRSIRGIYFGGEARGKRSKSPPMA